MLGFGDSDGEAVTNIHMQHDVHVGAAVADVDYVVGAELKLSLQLIEDRDLSISGGGTGDGFDLPGLSVTELGAVNVVAWNDTFKCRLDNFNRGCGEDVEVEVVAVDSGVEDLIEQSDVLFQADALADFVKMLASHT